MSDLRADVAEALETNHFPPRSPRVAMTQALEPIIKAIESMQSDKTCGNCKHWSGDPDKETIPWMYSYCYNDRANDLVYDGLATHKEFGCNHWEKRE